MKGGGLWAFIDKICLKCGWTNSLVHCLASGLTAQSVLAVIITVCKYLDREMN